MAWVPLSGCENNVDINDKPRKLTEAEINYILSKVPTAPSADSVAAAVCADGIKQWIGKQLMQTEIAPSAIPKLIYQIIQQHKRSLVVPQTPIGIIAAEAVGSTTTQMTLNTFHKSGSSKSASFGIEAMRDLIFARKTPKNESCTIYFENKGMSYEEVLDMRRYLVGSMASDFIKDYDIDTPNNLQKYWWHTKCAQLFKKTVPNSGMVLRLFLNLNEMYKHKVSIATLASVLEKEVPQSVVTIFGPIADGIIDVYPDPNLIASTLKGYKIDNVPPYLMETVFLESIVWPELSKLRVKGISGIKEIYPIVSPVWRMVAYEKKVDSYWYLVYNKYIMKATGLTPENLAALCKNAGMTIIGGHPDYLVVQYVPDDQPPDDNDKEYNNPNKYINRRIAAAKFENAQLKERLIQENIRKAQTLQGKEKEKLIKKQVEVPRSAILKSAEFIIAETDGSNLRELMMYDGIDRKRTTCNNIHVIAQTLGIEAARNFFVRSLTNVISNNGSYVNPTNITFIAEFITNRGQPFGATYLGISRQAGGHLSLATLERAGKVFTQSALHGKKEDIRNVSASVAAGARMWIGSGAFDIAQDILVDGNTKTFINDDLFTAIKNTNVKKRLNSDQLKQQLAELAKGNISNQVLDLATDEGKNADLMAVFNAENNQLIDNKSKNIKEIKESDKPLVGILKEVAKEPQKLQPLQPINSTFIDVTQQTVVANLPDPVISNKPVSVEKNEIVSNGYVFLPERIDKVDGYLPTEIRDLIRQYLKPEEVVNFPTSMPPSKVVELPKESIPELPSLADFDLNDLEEERKRNLEPIDTAKFTSYFKQ